MLELSRDNLFSDQPPAGLTPRLASLVNYCARFARECVEAVENAGGCLDDGGLRFAVVTEPADLKPDGALSAFLGAEGDPLPEVRFRLEDCCAFTDLRVHLLLFSVSDTAADYLVLPDECLPLDWVRAVDDLCAAW